MVKHSLIASLLLLLASPSAFSCYDPAGLGECGPLGIGPANPGGFTGGGLTPPPPPPREL